MMSDTAEIINLIRKVQLKGDKESKNILLAKYYPEGCKWAQKLLKSIIYTDLIVPTNSEVASLVYQSFEKSLNNIKLDNVQRLSFKNFFYLMIKYQIYAELKTTLNYKVISNYEFEINKIKQERKTFYTEQDQINELDIQNKLSKIIEFLGRKNSEYEEIILLKSQGYKNREICKKMALTDISLKARLQYIKKLIRQEFGCSLSDI